MGQHVGLRIVCPTHRPFGLSARRGVEDGVANRAASALTDTPSMAGYCQRGCVATSRVTVSRMRSRSWMRTGPRGSSERWHFASNNMLSNDAKAPAALAAGA